MRSANPAASPQLSARTELLAVLAPDEMYSMSGQAIASIQLAALRMRFAEPECQSP
jgi:hypothetical protein